MLGSVLSQERRTPRRTKSFSSCCFRSPRFRRAAIPSRARARIYSAAEKRSRTPPEVGCLASVRSGGAGPRRDAQACRTRLSPVGSRTVRRLDGRRAPHVVPGRSRMRGWHNRGNRKSETGTMMRKSVWMVGAMLAASLGGCASTGVYEAETALHETFIVDTNSQAAFRRAGEYVRACHVNVAHPTTSPMPGSPSWARRARRRGAGLQGGRTGQGAGTDHVRSRKPEQGQGDDHRGRRRPLGQGRDRRRPRLDRGATPACRQGG